jgi:hypothetical protein
VVSRARFDSFGSGVFGVVLLIAFMVAVWVVHNERR